MAVIGMDLDNTIIHFDRAFRDGAVARGWLAGDCPVSRIAVRTQLRAQPDGNARWTELQTEVYGQRILREATVCDGLPAFWQWAAAAGHTLIIASHKSICATTDPTLQLRDVAQTWLAQQTWFQQSPPAQLHFADTALEKIAQIRAARCEIFIDDRPEILIHPRFPSDSGTQPIWYTADSHATQTATPVHDLVSLSHWNDIQRHVAHRGAVAS